MMNALLILWTFIAACASFAVGAWMTFATHSETWPGVALMLLAIHVSGLGIQNLCEHLNRVRPSAALRHEYVEPARVRRQRPTGVVSRQEQRRKKLQMLGQGA